MKHGTRHGLAARLAIAMMLGLWTPRQAVAAEPQPTRTLNAWVQQGSLQVTCDYRDVFARKVQAKLSSGLPTRVVLALELRSSSGKTVAGWARSMEIVYDLWEERYQITIEDDRGRRRATVARVEEAMAVTGQLLRDRVIAVSPLPAGQYKLHVAVEINPVSRRMVENIRRWLARPPAGKSADSGQTNLFGSFVGTFVDRRIGQADHSVEFDSQWFQLGHP
ncbi:MAG: DUF4390 domain-containing protein [Myxococcota bacterium]|jgi:hypothetical protein|nr:DUF4390 domain-containing protein [Myxococcota bacterium]